MESKEIGGKGVVTVGEEGEKIFKKREVDVQRQRRIEEERSSNMWVGGGVKREKESRKRKKGTVRWGGRGKRG